MLGLAMLWRERGRSAYVAFALGMFALATREVVGALAVEAFSKIDALELHRYRLLAEAFVPGLWILFSLTFARANATELRRRWRLRIAASFAIPPAIVIGWWPSLLVADPPFPLPSWLVPIGPAGFVVHVLFLLAAVVVLMNLELTLRSATGSVLWQIKFLVLAIGVVFGVELFLHSQVLLHSWIQTPLFPFGSSALLLGSALVVVAFVRRRGGLLEIYPSESMLFNSLTLLVVGAYLLVVAGLVDVIDAWGGTHRAPLVAFVVLVAILGLATLLLSAELRQRARRFVNRHLQRPSYDYRQVWDTFTQHTSLIAEIEPLCAGITKTVAETFGCSVATIWLVRSGERKIALGGTTALPQARAREILRDYDDGRALIDIMESNAAKAVDLDQQTMSEAARELCRHMGARYVVALGSARDEPTGFLTLNERITKEPFNVEDFSLLKTFGDQAAAIVANRRMTQELQRAKEMEAFQTLSTFFVHDLKNLASRLSLALQNLPAHFENPDFRKDLLATMAKSVSKIDTMTARLSSITKGMELSPVECDLNALIRETLEGLNGSMTASLTDELEDIPKVRLDREQIQKVLTNLMLNAQEAVGKGGHVAVRTSLENGWVLLSVQDNGCGMSDEFVQNALFKPFQTTKKQGLGIGLFHSKQIIEAHGGRIEVESEQGTGSTFRVLLPAESRATTQG